MARKVVRKKHRQLITLPECACGTPKTDTGNFAKRDKGVWIFLIAPAGGMFNVIIFLLLHLK